MSTISRFDGPIWEDQRSISVRELCTHDGAQSLAWMIQTYWSKRGKRVKCRIESVGGMLGNAAVYCVRSDLKNGLPVSKA